jgi:hypothetical protein
MLQELQIGDTGRGSYHRKGGDAMSDMQHSAGLQRTTLTDIDIPFGRLIMIFIKFTLAAIPATIILMIIFMLLGFVLTMIFGPGFMGPGPGPGVF